MQREDASRGRRWRSGTTLGSLFVPRRPSLPFIALLGACLTLVATFYAPDVDLTGTPPHLWIWLIANVGSAFVMTGVVWVMLRAHDRFGWHRWPLRWKRIALVAGLVFGAVAASVVRAELDSALEWEGYVHRFGFLFWAGVASFVGVALVGNIYVNLLRRIDDNEEDLRAQVVEISRTRSLVAQADENVRRDVAEVLHGTVQSRLLAAELRLETLARSCSDHERAAGEANELAAVLRELREKEVRTMSHQLHPPALRVGLVVAVRSLLARLEGQFNSPIHLDLRGDIANLDDPSRSRVPEPVRLTVYRAIEESVQNAIRHGRANEIWVELDLLPGPELAVRISDDGAGPSGGSTLGLGLASVAARVEGRNGRWSLTASERGGACLEAVVPFRGTDLGRVPTEPGDAPRRRATDRLADALSRRS
jgi:signal transduction histidine kinase